MFAYCLNNPVNLIDTEGTWPNLSSVFLGIAIAAAAVAFVALCVVTCGGAAAAGGAIVATTVAAQVGVAAGVSTAAFMSAAVSKAVETGVYESRKHKHEEDVKKEPLLGKGKLRLSLKTILQRIIKLKTGRCEQWNKSINLTKISEGNFMI